LFEARPPLEGDHGLIDGLLLVWLVAHKKLVVDAIQHWSHLAQSVMAWFSMGRESAIVHKVEINPRY